MDIFSILKLFGGLAMFLYGMRLMGDGLKESSSGTLKFAMEQVTNNQFKAFLLGFIITAVIQSSTATIVITSGLVAAGILTLHQSLGIVVGANVGTTVTGQIIRLLDLDASGGVSWLQLFKPSSLAPIALIIGIVIIMSGSLKNSNTIGSIAIGFGILFSGLLNMTDAVDVLRESGLFESLLSGLGSNPFIGYLTGAGVAFVLQSSSATIGILQAFSASGLLTFKAIYAVIVGVYLGDCVTTAIVCSIGTGKDAKRVGIVNIMFNFCKSVLVLVVVNAIHAFGLLDWLWNATVDSGVIANTNTVFNLACSLLLFPVFGIYEKLSYKMLPEDETLANKYQDKLDALNPVFFSTPALALRSSYDILLTMFSASRDNIKKAESLLRSYDDKLFHEIIEEEINIDLMTDCVSKYLVELSGHLKNEMHTAILDEYYKVVSEFERLGDQAEHIANEASELFKGEVSLSDKAKKEIGVLIDITDRILAHTELAFKKRNAEAAYKIEPLGDVVGDICTLLKNNHLSRMCRGECNIYVDSLFMNLLADIKRISDICSNVGIAVIVRVRPELANREHFYFAELHSGENGSFNEMYRDAHKEYFSRLKAESIVPPAQMVLNASALLASNTARHEAASGRKGMSMKDAGSKDGYMDYMDEEGTDIEEIDSETEAADLDIEEADVDTEGLDIENVGVDH